MPENAFIGKTKAPTATELSKTLGPAKPTWDTLLAKLATQHQLTDTEWKSYSPRAGWSLRVIHKKRNILYLIPYDGAFRVNLILGDKAIKSVLDSRPPDPIARLLREAKKYPEGNAVFIDVERAEHIELVERLTQAKLDN